jgi:PhoPQ-activated pathogenicity-related protein
MRHCIAFIAFFFGSHSVSSAGLKEYVQKEDKSFSWKLKEKKETPQGAMYTIDLVSQTWHDIKWEHSLVVYLPKDCKPTETMFLWNTGGKPSLITNLLALDIAGRIKAPLAFLYDIPNQPLFGGKKEDALIAETFVRYLETKDESWPLLFPMVKSVIKAMDAIQAFAKEEWKFEVKSFVVSGASKRGWTSWLTGATGDPRVKAIAPLVIDTLNMQKQTGHQLKSYGEYSKMIHDYVERKLVPLPDTAEARKLWMMVDPWMYRDTLKMPKMIINGANDPYWTLDALNIYWDDLKGDKWILYVPNAGHGLEQVYEGGKKDRNRSLSTLSAFAWHEITNTPMPKLQWKYEGGAETIRLEVTSDPAPKAARLWVADSATLDFRQSTWKELEAKLDKGLVLGEISRPKTGYRAMFGECEYQTSGMRYFLSTQIKITSMSKNP